MMHRTWLSRVNALVLALMVGGGGSGLPVFDALFHHFGGSRTLSHACVERADTRSAHSERCTLASALPALDRPDGPDHADRPYRPGHPRRLQRPGRPEGAPLRRPSLPRAPPVSIA
jgi:hypothetical protein